MVSANYLAASVAALAAVSAAQEVTYTYHFYPLYLHDMGTVFFGGFLPDDVKTHFYKIDNGCIISLNTDKINSVITLKY